MGRKSKNKWDYIKLRSFAEQRKQRVKKQPTGNIH